MGLKLMTKRLNLEEPTMKDAKSMAKNANVIEILEFADMPYPHTVKHARKFISEYNKEKRKKNRTQYCFGIKLKGQEELMGTLDIFDTKWRDRKAEVGIWLGRNHRDKGIASEAFKELLEFAFKKLKLNKVYAEATTDNKKMNKILKEFGFRKIGTMKDNMLFNGKKKDDNLWELLKRDYNKK